MARKKKNKKQQTFNVYPFLAEYGITNLPLSKAQEGTEQEGTEKKMFDWKGYFSRSSADIRSW